MPRLFVAGRAARAHNHGMRAAHRAVVLTAALAGLTRAAAAGECGDPRGPKSALALRSSPPHLTIRVERHQGTELRIACGTVVTPWTGSLPAGVYTFVVVQDGKVITQQAMDLTTPHKRATVVDFHIPAARP
jgi:hypothetical protein